MRIVARNSDTEPDLQHARQIIRLDALKALIGILLEQMDELTNPNIPHGQMDSLLQSMVRHFETELIRRAQVAGCDYVLPRSAFTQLLPEIIRGDFASLPARRSSK